VWEYDASNTSAPTLAVAAGRVLGAGGRSITAIDTGTGARDWQAVAPDVDDPNFVNDHVACGNSAPRAYPAIGPVVDGQQVGGLRVNCFRIQSLSSYGATATADLTTGALTWTNNRFVGVPYGADVVSQSVAPGGTLYESGGYGTGSQGPYVYLATGSVYALLVPGSSIGRPAIDQEGAWVTTPGALHARPRAGATFGSWDASLVTTATPTPSLSGDQVFVTDGATVKAFAGRSGSLVWAATLPSAGTDDAPAVSGGRVFVRTANQIVALDEATGATLWTGALGTHGTTAAGLGSPSIAGDIVYVGSQDGNLLAFDATGTRGCSGTPVACTPMSTNSIGGPPGASRPVPANGSVFIGALHPDGNEAVYKFSQLG
jgi:outer membrane protein assembly factor BamB